MSRRGYEGDWEPDRGHFENYLAGEAAPLPANSSGPATKHTAPVSVKFTCRASALQPCLGISRSAASSPVGSREGSEDELGQVLAAVSDRRHRRHKNWLRNPPPRYSSIHP
jgi:hypothetical protein